MLNNKATRIGGRKCRRYSGNHKDVVIRVRLSDKRELELMTGIMPNMNSMTPVGEVIQILIEMFKEKAMGNLSEGKPLGHGIKTTENVLDFLDKKKKDKQIEDLNESLQIKQEMLDRHKLYLKIACELGHLDELNVKTIAIQKQKQQEKVSQTKDVMV